MIAFDTNILIYAHRPDYALHEAARAAIGTAASGPMLWAIPWSCVHEFYATVTNPRVHRNPTSAGGAWQQIDSWRESPGVRLLSEGPDHARHLRALTTNASITSGMVHDARIAAICLSHGVSELITMDRDFSRFPQLKTRSLLSS